MLLSTQEDFAMSITRRLLLVAFAVFTTATLQADEGSGVRMAKAANDFLATLSPEQKAGATFEFAGPERVNWHYIPLEDKDAKKSTRKGLPLEALNADQKKAALELLRAGTSPDGFKLGQAIMERELFIGELEMNKAWTRKPGWYFISVFGTPGDKGDWGWRWEGHHLALNYAISNGKVVAETPFFFGANPATVIDGPKKGERLLPGCEDLARELFNALDDKQQAAALQKEHFPDVEGKTTTAPTKEPAGVPAAQFTPAQRELLMKLIDSYLERIPADVAESERAAIRKAGIDKIHFAYTGEARSARPHTYRVQGPTVFIHYMCDQSDPVNNPGNHIHSVFRNLTNDFGLPLPSGK